MKSSNSCPKTESNKKINDDEEGSTKRTYMDNLLKFLEEFSLL